MLKRKSGELKLTRPLAIRAIHWLLALTVFLTYFIFYDGDWTHRYLGYASLVALLLRAVFFLYTKKRFTPLSKHPKLAKFTHLFIWLFVFFVGLTGWMMTFDRFWGEDWIEDLHFRLSQVLIFLVVFHLIGIFWDAYNRKRPTWMFMIR